MSVHSDWGVVSSNHVVAALAASCTHACMNARHAVMSSSFLAYRVRKMPSLSMIIQQASPVLAVELAGW